MNRHSLASTIAATGSWTGVAVILPIGATLLAAAALLEIGQVLLGLADLTCAACPDPSNGMGTGPATVGAVGTGLVLGSVVGSGSGLGGGPTPPYSSPPSRPYWTDPADDVGDVTPNVVPPRPPDSWYQSRRIVGASDQIEKWSRDVITAVEPYVSPVFPIELFTGSKEPEKGVGGAPQA